MKTIGIIGSGNIGQAVAKLALKNGFEVSISNSRGPDTLPDLAAALGLGCRAANVANAAASDLVIVSIPFFRFGELDGDLFAGKTVIDTMNFDPNRDGAVADHIDFGKTPGEVLQKHFADAHVVKAFSNIFSAHIGLLARPSGSAGRSALPIAGNSATAKAQVTKFLDAIGWDAVDAGPMSASATFGLGKPAFVAPYLSNSEGNWGLRLMTDPGAPLNARALERLLEAGR